MPRCRTGDGMGSRDSLEAAPLKRIENQVEKFIGPVCDSKGSYGDSKVG